MSRIAYVNGQYVPFRDAGVHIEDRGYQFADGVYEVIAFHRGVLIDEAPHLDRLERSLAELTIPMPMARRALSLVIRRLIGVNGIAEGILYLQVTRGVARRDHPFPAAAEPSLVMTVRKSRPASAAVVAEGVGVITLPDLRWRRPDIKSIALLPNVLGKQQARQAGAFEAWLLNDQGEVTEGCSTNAWIVDAAGALVTAPTDRGILNGITRGAVKKLVAEMNLKLVERRFTVAEAKQAREAFVTSTTSWVMPVVSIDGAPVGGGKPGPVALELRRRYADYVERCAEAGR